MKIAPKLCPTPHVNTARFVNSVKLLNNLRKYDLSDLINGATSEDPICALRYILSDPII